MSRTGEVVDALTARGIKATPATPTRAHEDGASVSFPLADAQWFADAILPTPLPPDDGLATRFFGRVQDMTSGDDPWLFEIYPSIPGPEDGPTFRVTVNIPAMDVDEVLSRLESAPPRVIFGG
jgi:hypothetical protein